MHESCAACGLVYEREQGYFVGAIYLNYAATAVVTFGLYLVLDAVTGLSFTVLMALGLATAVLFPLAFFRYSRSFWLAVDFFFDPERPDVHVVRRSRTR